MSLMSIGKFAKEILIITEFCVRYYSKEKLYKTNKNVNDKIVSDDLIQIIIVFVNRLYTNISKRTKKLIREVL